tara:strand:- start:414 stop:521 length:108 start_codon:yes stop_codon:yes gene_type:complete
MEDEAAFYKKDAHKVFERKDDFDFKYSVRRLPAKS